MDIALVVAVLAVAVAFGVIADTFWVAFFRVAPQGRFKVSIDNPSSFSFLTSLGAFSVQHANKVLSFSVQGRRGVVPLSEIKALEYRARVTDALVQELFFGYGLTDLMGPYRDTVEWYSISAVTKTDDRIPIYVGGEYQPREFLMTWYIDLQARWLEKLGLVHDEAAESRAALNMIQRQLGNLQLI